ncbi:MAG: aminopeptidase, partial [Hyphomicrobiales bacterium]
MSEPASQISRRGLPPQATTILLAIGGAIIFSLANLPLPLLLGPIFGCLIGALLGLPLKGAGQISVGMRTIVGVAVGASVTPALFARLPEMAMSVSLIPFFILVIGLIGYPWFRKFCGFDHATSYYSAMPGGLQDMLVFGEEAGGDPRALSLIHATRVMVIVSAAPFLLQYLWGLSLDHPPGEPVSA